MAVITQQKINCFVFIVVSQDRRKTKAERKRVKQFLRYCGSCGFSVQSVTTKFIFLFGLTYNFKFSMLC